MLKQFEIRPLILLCALVIAGCTEDFSQINIDPNRPEDVTPDLLFRKVIYNLGEELSYEGFVAGNLLAQHFAMVDFNLFDRHSLSDPQLGGNPWPVLYSNLRDIQIIQQKSLESDVFSVYEGPALILKAYVTAQLTDIYGDVPYSEAVLGLEGISKPKYDSQEDIYLAEGGILSNIEMAIDVMDSYTGSQQLKGDILFDGDLDGWKRFANSLKLKYLTRISDATDTKLAIKNIFETQDYIDDRYFDAKFDFTSGLPNSFRMQQLRDGDFNLFVMSETMEGIFNELDDPRELVLFRPIGSDSSMTIFNGLKNGPDASQTSITVSDYSLTGTVFREETDRLDANFMTSWETQFLLAEAAFKNWIDSDAKFHYDLAITMAFEYWGVSMPEDYLESGKAAFMSDEQDGLEQIITQKWIAGSVNSYEPWIEYRRTGFPKLKQVSASLNDDLIPSRMPYPAEESVLNSANYEEATKLSLNSVNFPVWWDLN